MNFLDALNQMKKRYPNETPVLGRLLVLGPEEGNRRHAHKG